MLNSQINDFMSKWNAEWATLKADATPQDRRAHFEVVAANMALPKPEDVDDSAEHWIDSAAGRIRVRVYRHRSGGTQDCLIYAHGGAFMQGSPETHADITARIASWNRQTVVSLDYALCPEHPFPAAFDQACDVARWCRDNAETLGIDPARIAIGGDSAGGNLSAAVALAMKDFGFLGQLLIYPCTEFDLTRPSMIENAEAPLLTTKGMAGVNRMLVGGAENEHLLYEDPRVAPYVADDHSGLAPAFIAVAENDPLRDSGVVYAEKLEAAGVSVTLDMGDGLIHGYLRSMEYCDDAQAKLRKMTDWLAAL
ncbi:alpha/beta hydrolase [Maritimibacter sp. UBA3975]|uniref:alpha/beta hydrolase n=1 Tax=Maritimibacter sp. UBA3975 TaxID=1946833 RepID=UPI000C0B84D9|nr:alpha/beta hydrolase [Maritimibacter sp. UBA3975]MAM63317.1 alpha/beta hydrolase [Maritimibacter sp.]|tara:strand:+ start:29863 stop:30792 length:930 start_codon:yes stop_codon:yes gene_type:complete